jgi:NADH:ubiquinone oxidoreductase subunit K
MVSEMIEFIGVVFGLGFFGLLVQRSVIGALLSVQVMTTAAILALVLLAGGSDDGARASAAMIGRARDAGLVFMIIFQIQCVAALAFVTRLHYLRLKSGVADLTTMRN